MRTLMAVCLLFVSFHDVYGWQTWPSLPPGRTCKINGAYTGTCKPKQDCESYAGETNLDVEEGLQCQFWHVCCPYKPIPRANQKPLQPPKPNLGESCTTAAGLTGTCRMEAACPSMKAAGHGARSLIEGLCSSPLLFCCLNDVSQLPMNEQLKAKPGRGEQCNTVDGSKGRCTLRQSCNTLAYNIDVRSASSTSECTSEFICCPDTEYRMPPTESITQPPRSQRPVTPLGQSPNQHEQRGFGEECTTAAGSRGNCIHKTSCNTLDYAIDVRSLDNECAAAYVCCPNTKYYVLTTESLTVRPESQTTRPSQTTTRVEERRVDKYCLTEDETLGRCVSKNYCRHLSYMLGYRNINPACDDQQVCCPITNYAAVTTTMSTPVTPLKPNADEMCTTVAGLNGICTQRQSCNTLDYAIDVRSGDNICALEYVCCPNTNFYTPATESLTRPMRRTQPPRQLDVRCTTRAGLNGKCAPRQSCDTLDHDLDVRTIDSVCGVEDVCCPNTNFRMPASESITVRPVSRTPPPGQSNVRCTTPAGLNGKCTPRQSCDTLDHDLDVRIGDSVCGLEDVCCPNTNFRMPTSESITVRPVSRTPPPGQLNVRCTTPAGLNGKCTPRQSCDTLDHDLDVRIGDSVCGAEDVCCPNTKFRMPASESITVRPVSRTPPLGQLNEDCTTRAGSNGKCTLRQSCDTLDHDIDIRSGYTTCALEYVCCPNTNFYMPTDEPLTTRPGRQTPRPGQSNSRCRTTKVASGVCAEIKDCTTFTYEIDFSQCGTQKICCSDTTAPTTTQRTWITTKRAKYSPVPETTQDQWSASEGFNCAAARKENEGPQCGLRQSVALKLPNSWGRSIERHEFPWMVAVLRYQRKSSQRPEKLEYICGGSLIHYQVVLTAAHCFDVQYNINELFVKVGAWDISRVGNKTQGYFAERVIVHPGYDQVSNIYDVALIITKKRFKKSSSVGLICLPTPDITVEPDSCLATGWGLGATPGSRPLRMETLPLVDSDICQRQLANVINLGFTLHNSFLCAGGMVNKDTCKGDGGSPLICTNGVRYYQLGIVSWGVDCGHQGIPGVYSDVGKVVPWISNQMRTYGMRC